MRSDPNVAFAFFESAFVVNNTFGRMVRLGREVKNSQARTGHQRGMGGDAGQMMTTCTSDTQTQTSSQDTQPAGCHTP